MCNIGPETIGFRFAYLHTDAPARCRGGSGGGGGGGGGGVVPGVRTTPLFGDP